MYKKGIIPGTTLQLFRKVVFDKCCPIFILTTDILNFFPLKNKKKLLLLTVSLSALFYVDFVLLLIVTLGCFPYGL